MTAHRSEAVRLELDPPVARIVLDAPERHNALTADDVASVRDHLERVDSEADVRVLVLTGAGPRTFCSGASLPQMESGEMTPELFETLTSTLAALRAPAICALNGSVYGGGAELALCCDFRIGVRGSRLAVPAARLGVCYPAGGLSRYVARLGLGAAQRILLAGEELEAEEMLRIGFLTELVDPRELGAATDRLAERLAAHAPLAVQAMKRILGDVAGGTPDATLAAELVRRCEASSDMREGLLARREGREPRFEGR